LGTAAAVAFTSLIVLLSPVKELTTELLARTRPNLFDLVVAILSGAAGGYALIRGRGGAIVGVAIATALMPPLATIGYGLVTERWPVARGALLLFFTNMAAISLSVAAVAEWYGFGRGGLRKRFAPPGGDFLSGTGSPRHTTVHFAQSDRFRELRADTYPQRARERCGPRCRPVSLALWTCCSSTASRHECAPWS
jgi:hypothetical protein